MTTSNMADAESEDLEYHVTFPTAISAAEGNENGGGTSELDRREPVVILLGWVGCEDRHLGKYSAIYHSLGFTTVRYTAPTEDILYNPLKLKDIARKVLELVFDLGLEENVVFFHIFSNGGCFIYKHLTEFLHDPQLGGELSTVKVAGCVYDSCPCAPSLLQYMKVRNAADKTSGFFMKIIKTIALLLFAVLAIFLPSNWKSQKERSKFMSAMKTDPSRYPQLFLYSKTDEICPWRDVDDVVEARRKREVHVQQVCWDESNHCTHLLAHRDEYIQRCQDFAQGCLQNFLEDN
ncbi:transmembrane protein 53-like [Asterias amurensis]|uniref:transmembrane protein 53-like n=1 Tax=Asterias amurensis TaxID=7602 RepID=UPI003AB7A2C9